MERDKDTERKFGGKWIIYKHCNYGIGQLCMKTLPCKHYIINLTTSDINILKFTDISKLFKQEIEDFDYEIHGYRVNNIKKKR